MFMFARAYALAKKYNHKIIIVSEISGYSVRQNILQYLCLDKKLVKRIIRLDWTKNQYIFRFIRKLIFDYILKLPCFIQIFQSASDSRVFLPIKPLSPKKIYVVDGYWECHQYFDEYRENLIDQFVPQYPLSKTVTELIDQIANEDSLVIHVRKGDFNEFGRLIDDDYYLQAYLDFKKKHTNIKLYILTEDDDVFAYWHQRFSAKRIIFNTENRYLDEWYAMTKCKYHIIANSTYSWWSSYICNSDCKEIIYPSYEQYKMAEKTNTIQMYKNYY